MKKLLSIDVLEQDKYNKIKKAEEIKKIRDKKITYFFTSDLLIKKDYITLFNIDISKPFSIPESEEISNKNSINRNIILKVKNSIYELLYN